MEANSQSLQDPSFTVTQPADVVSLRGYSGGLPGPPGGCPGAVVEEDVDRMTGLF
jgi:hypothetical protein